METVTGGLRVYRAGAFETTHENQAFDALVEELKRVWGESSEQVVLIGNFLSFGSEIDAAVFRRRSITVIDLKNYGGEITFSENGPWWADGVAIRGGNQPNPYLQVRKNRFSLLEFLKSLNLPSGNKNEFGHISGMVLFHQPVIFNEGQLPPSLRPWFHITDLDNVAARLSQISSRKLNLSSKDLEVIVEALGAPAYAPIARRQPMVSPAQLPTAQTAPRPATGLLAKARWDAAGTRYGTVRPPDQVEYDPGSDAGQPEIPGFAVPTKELRNLFLHVAGSLAPLGVRIAAYRHHSYQEVYRLEEDAGAGCTLRLYYDRDFAVTRLDLAHEGSPDLAQKVQATLTRGASALSPVQQAIFEELSRRFSEAGIRVLTVKHRAFQEVYFLDTQNGAVELMVYYDKAGLVTRITPSRAEYPGAAQAVALALGVQP